MAIKTLPAYFKEYLDEKFDHVSDKVDGVEKKVNGVKKEVEDVKKELKRMNGDLADQKIATATALSVRKQLVDTYVPKVKANAALSKKNEKWIRRLSMGVIIGSAVWIKESRDFLLKIIVGIISSFN
jgi:regulator of replication initiation timing